MFDLPKSTEIRKPIHKKLIYQKFSTELSRDKKSRFDEDISRIIITNEISENSINIKATEDVSAIFVVQIELKTRDYNVEISYWYRNYLVRTYYWCFIMKMNTSWRYTKPNCLNLTGRQKAE